MAIILENIEESDKLNRPKADLFSMGNSICDKGGILNQNKRMTSSVKYIEIVNSAFGRKINLINYFKFVADQVLREAVYETGMCWQEVFWGVALQINTWRM